MTKSSKLCTAALWLAIFLAVSVIFPNHSYGQGGFPTPTPTTTPTTIPSQSQAQGQQGQQGQQTPQSGGQQTAQTNDGGVVQIDPSQAVEFNEFQNTRNQGFVGATSNRMNEAGFIGAPSANSGSSTTGDADFGGGVNTQFGTAANGGTGGAAAGRGGQGGQGFAGQAFGGQAGGLGQSQLGATNPNSFTVQRGGLRGSIQPSFTSPVMTNNEVVEEFSTNFSQLPQSQMFGGQYQVVVNNKKATVSGWVNSKAESDHLIAQLRFQPGVYEIENKLEIRE